MKTLLSLFISQYTHNTVLTINRHSNRHWQFVRQRILRAVGVQQKYYLTIHHQSLPPQIVIPLTAPSPQMNTVIYYAALRGINQGP